MPFGSYALLILLAKSLLQGLASLQTSVLSGQRASIRADFRLRQQYQCWVRAYVE